MNLSVIASTYNAPAWLEKLCWGFAAQTFRDFELVIADDGSTDETRDLLARMREETGLTIRHVRQEDNGFRKCRILNKAILRAEAPYLVFTDGDCIPRKDFLAVHAAEAEHGHYLAGSFIRLPRSTSEAIGKEDILSQRCFNLEWLKIHGLLRSRKNRKLSVSPVAASFLNRMARKRKCTFKGGNGSAWRDDVLRVNGFDERMAWGGLDREFGVRLVNAGVRPKHVRFSAIVLHLDHARGYKDPCKVKENKKLRRHNEKNGVMRTDYGITSIAGTVHDHA